MRVFYPVSARISDLINDQATIKSGWASVLGVVTVVIIAIVSSNLQSFEGDAAEKQHEVFTQHHYKNFANNSTTPDQQRSNQS